MHPPGGAEPERRSPLAGAGHVERGVSPHPGRTQELRRRAEEEEESGGLEGPEGGRGRRVGRQGKSEAGRRRQRKVEIDASVFCCRCCPRAGSRAGGKAVER